MKIYAILTKYNDYTYLEALYKYKSEAEKFCDDCNKKYREQGYIYTLYEEDLRCEEDNEET